MANKHTVRAGLGAFWTGFAALVVVALMSVSTAKADGWGPTCSPPGCADVQDPIAATFISVKNIYPDSFDPYFVGFSTNSHGHISQASSLASRSTLPFQVGGLAGADCSTGFMSVEHCTMGPAGPQGKPNQCTAAVGDPINVLTGNHYEDATDFTTEGQSQLTLSRSYNSDLTYVISTPTRFNGLITPYQGRFGMAWRSEYDRVLVSPGNMSPSAASEMDAVRADGNPVHFVQGTGGVWYVAYWNSSPGNWSGPTDPRHDVDLRLSTDGTYWYIQDQNDTIEKYDATGKLLQITYRGGYYQTLAYDTSGNNTTVTDSFGKTLTFTYLANGLVDTVTDPTSGVIHYSYLEVSGTSPTPVAGHVGLWMLQTVTYQDSKSLTYIYDDSSHRYALTGIVDEKGNRFATWTYDATTGRATSSQHAGGADLTTVSYDDVNSTRTITNALGKQTIYHLAAFQGSFQVSSIEGVASTHCPASTVSYLYDTNGYVSQTTSGAGRVNQYVNNSIGQETSRTEGYGSAVARTVTTSWNSTWREPDQIVAPNVTTDFTYDASGRLFQFKLTDTTSQTIPYSTNSQTRTWGYTYYANGLLHTVDGPLSGTGDTATYAYDTSGFVNSVTDVLGHITTITSNNGWGKPLASVDANSITTNYAYDLRGRITGITINPGANQAVYGFTYDDAGNLTVITRPDSSTLTYGYDNAHRLTSVTNNAGESITYTLDALGDKTAAVTRNASSTITKQASATFDELGRLLTSIGAASQTTTYGYDLDNNQTSVTDPRSKVYGYAFDALNRLYQQTDPNSFVTTTAYDAQDNPTSVTDARSLITTYVRDGFGDVIRQVSPDTGTADFWYDANGAVTKQVDARGIETDFTNDNAGRVLTKTFPAAPAENVTYSYDATAGGNKGVGQLTSITDQSGSTSYVYDALGHTTSDTRVISGQTYATAYTYDAAGNILTETYPSGRIVTYTRDALGRISGIATKQNAGSTAVNVATGITYKPFGSVTGLTFGNSVVATLSYDQDYQLTGIASAAGATTIQSLTNGYDPAGNITSITDALTPARSQTVTYENLNRIATASGAYGSQSYTYDGVGNRVTRGLGSATDIYAYSPTANRISTITTGANVRTFSYLATGQVSGDQRDTTHNYTFTANNNGRNASASLNSSGVGSYLYNGLEQRVQKVAGGTTNQFVYDEAGHLIQEVNSVGVVQKEYIWLDDLPVTIVDDSGASPVLYFIHTDQLGTPQKITNVSAVIVWDGLFDPFGNPVSGTGSAIWGSTAWGSFSWGTSGPSLALTNLRFPGQYYDPEVVLHQNWNRDYDPTTGRYVQSDPIGLLGGPNTYAYVGGEVVGSIDPTGTQEFLLFGRLPPILENLLRTGRLTPKELELPKETIPRQLGKQAADDPPSWCRGQRPTIRETGKEFAKRLLDEKYGPGKYPKGPDSEFNKIRKWGDRNFRIPESITDRLGGT